jgi:Fibronectin type III domain
VSHHDARNNTAGAGPRPSPGGRADCSIGGQIARGTGLKLAVLAVAALLVTGLSSAPALAAVHDGSRVNAAIQHVPHTKTGFIKPPARVELAWEKAMRDVRTPHHGCFTASYPALAWHAVKCHTAPPVPLAPARPAGSAAHAAPATVGDETDYVAQVSGTINQATGTFPLVSGGIKETGLVDNKGTEYSDAFSLQLNSNDLPDPPACTGSSDPSGCYGWQQFLYTYGTSGAAISVSSIYMQYWLLGYGTTCPSGYGHPVGDTVDCFMNSQQTDVPSLTASDLASVALSGAAEPDGTDELSMMVGPQAYTVSASDSVLDLAGNWNQTEWGVYGDANRATAGFGAGTTLEAMTSLVDTSGAAAPACVSAGINGTTAEKNNLSLAATPSPGSGTFPTATSLQTNVAGGGTASCVPEPGYQPSPASGLSADGLTSTWQAQSDLDSTGSPQPLPTTTSDCGNWSGGDGTQVVGLSNGDDLWTFGDTYLGPAVARQDFFNNGFIHNSMVLQDGSSFTTVTGGSGCASGQPTTATAPITASGGGILWPASSIVYAGEVEKFYYTASAELVQLQPQVAEIPQGDLESGDTYSQQAVALSGCTDNPIMWGAATISSGGYTYIYGSQQYSSTGGDTGGNGGELYLARTTGDPSDQGGWQYYTTSGWSQTGAGCDGLTLAALGGSEPIEVPTEFSVTSVNGDFWLVDQDPANGDQPGWAVAHEATTPEGFSNDPEATAVLFEPGQTAFSGIDDGVPGLIAYTVRMLEPSAVTPTQSGDVILVYQVNDSYEDYGCIPLDDYDANAYRPRFIDVPTSDLVTDLTAASSALRKPAPTAASPGTVGQPALTGLGGRPAQPEAPPTVRFSPQIAARGEAQLKAASRAGSKAAAASTSWTYDPDTVPSTYSGVTGTLGGALGTWSGSCPTSYPLITASDITVSQNPDGSVEVSWPNEGPDVWYWLYSQDDTSEPGIWNQEYLWTEGPNADGYFPAPSAGALVSTTSEIHQVFTLPTGMTENPGDKFSFWVQAFAAGNANVTSGDSSADAESYTPTSPSEKVSGLAATAGNEAVTLNWTAAPAPIPGQAIWYSVRYKPTSSSTWTYTTDYITNTADLTPLTGGTEYEFEVAVTDDATELTTNANWSAAVDATPLPPSTPRHHGRTAHHGVREPGS